MSWRKLGKLVVTMTVCLLVTTSCKLFSSENTYTISSTYAQKQFCQFALLYINEDSERIHYCYKYPVSAHTQLNWYWIKPPILATYLYGHSYLLEQHISELEQKNGSQVNNRFILDPHKPIVYLTFDDGPGKYTDQVLDILKEENIKGTFFVLGEQVARHPLFTKRIVDEGHTIGNHSYNHEYNEIYSNFAQFSEQVIETNKIVYDLTGEQMTLFRAPGGSINNLDESYFTALNEVGFHVFDWNVDSRDSIVRNITSEQIILNIKTAQLFESTIVLLHNTNRHEQTMLALRDIISYYRELGYQFAPITMNTEELTFNLGKNMKWDRAEVTPQQIKDFRDGIAALYK